LRFLFRGVSARAFVRPFSTLDHSRIRFASKSDHRRFRAVIIRRPPKKAIERIKELFLMNVRYNANLVEIEYPQRLDAYDIGSNIACGCHAAVYELRLRRTSEYSDAEAAMSSASRHISETTTDPIIAYPLALKIMFNYQFDAPERYLWADMGSELVPFVDANRLIKGHLPVLQTLRRSHPNVIKIYTAFADCMPMLADAQSLYPEALPNANFYELIIDQPKTLFIVMKRYRMTLREYVLTVKRNYWIARVMLGQLLEAIVFLYEHTISHRDMKSDNILLDFDSPEEAPHLVLSDFGCALATGSWLVPYPDDTIDLGGNLALRAPEIRCAHPGPGQIVDFRMADLWACATLGYEMYTRFPFSCVHTSNCIWSRELSGA
uniref:non-specific serine/threonine protein kinase n=1 Tax=Toxocara canis TaxID=6265 RepID=A0A183U195_TOXCA